MECAHRRCWIEEAHVTELTGLLRDGPAGDQLAGWPRCDAGLRPPRAAAADAQLTLFEADDGWRYSLRVTNRPAATRGWLGQHTYIDSAHRVHARVEAKAKPKTPRHRILHAAARLTRSGRRRRLKVQASWPWTADIVTACERISALPQAP